MRQSKPNQSSSSLDPGNSSPQPDQLGYQTPASFLPIEGEVEEGINDDDDDEELPEDLNQRWMALDPYGEHVGFYLNWERDRAAEAEKSKKLDEWIDSLTPEELANDPF